MIFGVSTLYLIPTPISDSAEDISAHVVSTLSHIHHFIVENLRTARRTLRKMGYQKNFDTEVSFYEIEKHHNPSDNVVIDWMKNGTTIGILSEAGLPCIADPGAHYVSLAYRHSYHVIPLSGPSSILLALIASGFHGQNFAFNGYLPIDKSDRLQKLKELETRVVQENQTQLFMDTPYRNMTLYEDILKHCSSSISLHISADLTSATAYSLSQTIGEWKRSAPPNLHKRPAIFVLGIKQ